jgi:tRNA threonylcarbamoyladenosine biosynthesis protein TsaE
LVADLGGGKTTFTQGLVRGLGSQDKVSSPTFTLKKVYTAGKKQIFHYDFYRLSDPGILKDELAEALGDESIITVIEWSGIVKDILPPGHITIKFQSTPNDPEERQITISYPESFAGAIRGLETHREGLEP